jgi:DNA-directed RNA polymerase specialized sigma24 family protein
MAFSTKSPLLDHSGKPLPEEIQGILDHLRPRFLRKFAMIRDEVVQVEILEEAGQRVLRHQDEHGAIRNVHAFAWVTLRNVAISRLRQGPHLLEQPIAGSAQAEAALARIPATEGSPESMDQTVLWRQVLDQMTVTERKIAIWRRQGISSQRIANNLGMTVTAIDTTYSRLVKRLQEWHKPGAGSM